MGINDRIFVFDGISHQMWNSSFTGCYGLDLSDIDNDSIKEIIVGTRDGRIVAIDGQTYSEEFNIMASTSSISAIRAFDINEDGFTVLDGDCDDTDPNVYSGAPELCDGKDNDCDGIIPADESDQDADGYSVCEGDSNDNDNKIYPGATGKKEKYEKKKDLQLSSYSIYLSILQLQGLLKRHFIGPYYNFQDWSQEYIRLNWLFNYNNIDPVSYLPFYNWNSGFYNDYSFGWQQFSRYPKKLY